MIPLNFTGCNVLYGASFQLVISSSTWMNENFLIWIRIKGHFLSIQCKRFQQRKVTRVKVIQKKHQSFPLKTTLFFGIWSWTKHRTAFWIEIDEWENLIIVTVFGVEHWTWSRGNEDRFMSGQKSLLANYWVNSF